MLLPYTICFIIKNDKVLLLFRNKAPNQFKWNGVGGKIEHNETPHESIKREIMEETGLIVNEVIFRGIVTWNNRSGMYVFIGNDIKGTCIEGPEGKLEWKELNWIYKTNEVVSNIPYFLDEIMSTNSSLEHSFLYSETGGIISYDKKELHPKLLESVYKVPILLESHK